MVASTVVPGGNELLGPVPAGAVRRTATVQIDPEGDWLSGSRVTAIGRDLVHRLEGDVEVVNERFELVLDVDDAMTFAPGALPPGLASTSAKRGLRKRVVDLRTKGEAGQFAVAGGLPDALLDDVPGIIVVGGYGKLYDRVVEGPTEMTVDSPASQVCLGFHGLAASGEGFSTSRFLDKEPVAEFVSGDPMAWHDDIELPAGAVRRRRMIEVRPVDGVVQVSGYFRDTFRRPDGVEVVVHEYGLSAVLSGDPMVVDSVTAHPGKLPMEFCPGAANGAAEVVGARVTAVDGVVRTNLLGPRSCTHLNDEFRALRLVPGLIAELV